MTQQEIPTRDTVEKNRQRWENISSLVDRLCQVIGDENQLLEAHKVHEVSDLVEEKVRLFRTYREHLKALLEEPESTELLQEDTRSALKDKGQRLQEMMQKNERLLKSNIEAGHRFLDAVLQAAREEKNKTATYCASGVLGKKEAGALSFDETL